MKKTSPSGRDGHTMARAENNCIYVFGGYIEGRCTNELWELEPEKLTWKKLGSTARLTPAPRANHSSICWHCKAKNDDVVVIFGGVSQTLERLDELWLYYVNSESWEEVKHTLGAIWPTQRSEHSAAIYNDKMLIFGGRGEAMKELNDLMILDLPTMKWSVASNLCLKPLPDKAFAVSTSKESPGLNKSNITKIGDCSFSIVANSEATKRNASPAARGLSPQLSVSKQRDAKTSSPINMKRKKKSPPKIRVSEIESALEELKILTPTTSSMLHSVVMHVGEKALEPYLQAAKRRRKISGMTALMKQIVGAEETELAARGRIPCARSGHSVDIVEKQMIIFGGDRAQVALNDMYLFDLSGL